MRSPLLIMLLTIIISLTMPVCDVLAYGGGGGGGGGSDRVTDSDVMESSAAQCTSFIQATSYPLGIGCGWGVGVVGPQDVSDAGGSAYGDPIEDSRSTSKDAQTALNELRDKFEAGSMTAQDVKQDLQWGQQMGVYTSEQSQSLLQDLNIEKAPNQPPSQQPAQQQSPAAPPAPQKTKYEQDIEKIRFLLSMMFDYDPDDNYLSYLRDSDVTYWTIKSLYLRGRDLQGAYRDDEKTKAARERMNHYNNLYRKIKRAADKDYNSRGN